MGMASHVLHRKYPSNICEFGSPGATDFVLNVSITAEVTENLLSDIRVAFRINPNNF